MIDNKDPFFPKLSELIKLASVNPPMLDLGTNKRFAKELKTFRALFKTKDYFALGTRIDKSDIDACDFDCDAHDISAFVCDSSFGSVICLSLLEHV